MQVTEMASMRVPIHDTGTEQLVVEANPFNVSNCDVLREAAGEFLRTAHPKYQVHWYLDVTFGDDQMRARKAYAGHNLAILKRLTLNLNRLDPVKRKGSFKTKPCRHFR